MPFKNIPLDPNTIAMWDDGLLQTWKEDQRFTLLVRTTDYPLHLDKMEYWIGFDKHCECPRCAALIHRQTVFRDHQIDHSERARWPDPTLPRRESAPVPQGIPQSLQDTFCIRSRLDPERSPRV